MDVHLNKLNYLVTKHSASPIIVRTFQILILKTLVSLSKSINNRICIFIEQTNLCFCFGFFLAQLFLKNGLLFGFFKSRIISYSPFFNLGSFFMIPSDSRQVAINYFSTTTKHQTKSNLDELTRWGYRKTTIYDELTWSTTSTTTKHQTKSNRDSTIV